MKYAYATMYQCNIVFAHGGGRAGIYIQVISVIGIKIRMGWCPAALGSLGSQPWEQRFVLA